MIKKSHDTEPTHRTISRRRAGPVARERQGRGAESRTLINGFGDRYSAIELHPYIFEYNIKKRLCRRYFSFLLGHIILNPKDLLIATLLKYFDMLFH